MAGSVSRSASPSATTSASRMRPRSSSADRGATLQPSEYPIRSGTRSSRRARAHRPQSRGGSRPVHRRKPRRASVVGVWSRRRSGIQLSRTFPSSPGPAHPLHRVDDLHCVSILVIRQSCSGSCPPSELLRIGGRSLRGNRTASSRKRDPVRSVRVIDDCHDLRVVAEMGRRGASVRRRCRELGNLPGFIVQVRRATGSPVRSSAARKAHVLRLQYAHPLLPAAR